MGEEEKSPKPRAQQSVRRAAKSCPITRSPEFFSKGAVPSAGKSTSTKANKRLVPNFEPRLSCPTQGHGILLRVWYQPARCRSVTSWHHLRKASRLSNFFLDCGAIHASWVSK